jgi:hypothetical protein
MYRKGSQTFTRTTFFALATVVALAMSASAAQHPEPPAVPGNLVVEAGNRVYKIWHAIGTQNQICLPRPSGIGLGWSFFGPQATLFDGETEQVMTHFLSANPDESGTPRATWQHSRDTSTVWALAIQPSTDPNYVEAGAIPWLLLRVVGSEDGPNGGDRMSRTTFVQRVNTLGGVAPTTDCPTIGAKLLVPYEADYVFYRADRD